MPVRPRDARTATWFRGHAVWMRMVRSDAGSCEVGHLGNIGAEQTASHGGPDLGRHHADGSVGVDQDAALRLCGRDLPVGFAQAFMELTVLRLKAIRRAGAPSRRGRSEE